MALDATKYRDDLVCRITVEVNDLAPQRREEFMKMWLDICDDFCSSPGAHKLGYHHCWPGGLAEHALSVLDLARRLAPAVGMNAHGNDSLTIVCLFHDLGKSGGYYIPLDADNPKRASGERYKYVRDWHASHAQRSLWMLQAHGIKLSSEEYRAILLHDGQYVEANRRFGMNEPDLAYVLHWADVWDARHSMPNPFAEERP